jgi:hypothetical protein
MAKRAQPRRERGSGGGAARDKTGERRKAATPKRRAKPEGNPDLLCLGPPPETPKMLHAFLVQVVGVRVPTEALTPGSAAPFDYLVHTFFEGRVSAREPGIRRRLWRRVEAPADAVVWAARGAGKTFLGALATALDLVFKPGIEVRILGGSLEQSKRMHEHLQRLFQRPALAVTLAAPINEKRVVLKNGSRAQILAQSQTSVRGTRVQKLRCDEVELFDPEVWHAAQLTTRSAPIPGPWGSEVRGGVEALSTMHLPHGLMWNLVSGSQRDAGDAKGDKGAERGVDDDRRARVVFRWGIVDVLATCGPEHVCGECVIEPDCASRAKERDARRKAVPGHLAVTDAVRMKSRVSLAVWQSEMLCQRPRRSHCVFPEFDPAVHVGAWVPGVEPAPVDGEPWRPGFDAAPVPESARRWVVGMDFGIRAPTVALLAWYRRDDPEQVLHVEAEHVQAEWTIARHAEVLLRGGVEGWPSPAPALDWVGVDPAGHQRSDQTGHSSIAALRKAGLTVRSRRLPLQDGLEVLRVRFRPAAGGGRCAGSSPERDSAGEGSGTSGGSPRIYVHERCRVLIESLTKYRYPEERPESVEPVKDGSDHAVDALRYLAITLDKPHRARVSRY